MNWQTKDELLALLTSLVQYESITGSKGEAALAEYLYFILKDKPYFQKHPDDVTLHPMDDGRSFLTALVKKKNVKKTVLLLSHFDVVDIEDYGEFKHMACKPAELLSLLF